MVMSHFLDAALIYTFANVFYWNVGRSLFRFSNSKVRHSEWLYALVGILAVGFTGQILFFAKLPAGSTTALLGVLALVSLIFRRLQKNEVTTLIASTLLFAIAGFAQALVPFPGLGKWSGDWYFHYQLGSCLLRGEICSELVARPPLFAASMLPLRWWLDGLLTYQIANAEITAASAMCLLFIARKFRIALTPGLLATTLFTTPFFALHDTYPWPKFLSGACMVIAAFYTSRFFHRPTKKLGIAVGLWLAFAINAHHSAVLCFPLLLGFLRKGFWKQKRAILLLPLLIGLAVIVVIAPYEIWALHTFGLERRISENAGVSWRYGDPWLNFPRILFTTFITRAPWEVADFLKNNPLGGGPFSWAALVFFILSTWATAMAGTLGCLILPWLITPHWKALIAHAKRLAKAQPYLLAGLATTVLFHTLAFPHDTYVGTTQAGLVPLCLLFFLGMYSYLDSQRSEAITGRIVFWTFVTGTLPFLFSQFIPVLVLKLGSQGFVEKALPLMTTSDEDAKIYFGKGLASWGYALFPWGIFFCGVFLAAIYFIYRRGEKLLDTEGRGTGV